MTIKRFEKNYNFLEVENLTNPMARANRLCHSIGYRSLINWIFNQKCCNVDVAMKNSFASNYHKTRNTFAPSLSMCWNIVFGTGSAMLKVSSCLSA